MSAIFSLEVFQEGQARERFRARAHEALDRFLDGLETPMADSAARAPTLMKITEAVSQEGAGLTAALVEALVERPTDRFWCNKKRPALRVSASCGCGRRVGARWRRCWGR